MRPGAVSAPLRVPEPGLLTPQQAAELVAAARARDAGVLTVARVRGADPIAAVRAAAQAGAGAVEIGAEADAAAVRAAMRAGGLPGAALIAARDAANAGEADYVVFPHGTPADRRAPSTSGGGAGSPSGGSGSPSGGSGSPSGGSGSPSGWDPFTQPALKRVIVAGDIDAHSAAEVVRAIHPFAIDVGDAVRTPAGIIDDGRLRDLVAALAAADSEG